MAVALVSERCWAVQRYDTPYITTQSRRCNGIRATSGSAAAEQHGLAPATYRRITSNYQYMQGLSEQGLRTKRRVALQRLLNKNLSSPSITFVAGPLLKEKAQRLAESRQKAIESNERAQVARVVKAATKEISKNLVTEQVDSIQK